MAGARLRARWARPTGILVLGWASLTSGYAAGPDDVDYRQNVMKTLGAQALALELVLQERAPARDLEQHLKTLADSSAQILSAFEPAAEGGNAKPGVWSDWEDFAALADKQAERLAVLQSTQAGGEVDAATIREALACRQCHDVFRRDMEDATLQASGDAERDIVAYRRYLMQAMDAQTAALGQILAWMVADDHFVSHLEVIATTAEVAVRAFEPAVMGGEALPGIWNNRADFRVRMQALTDGTGEAAAMARERGRDAALVRVMDALTCEQCHELYRKAE